MVFSFSEFLLLFLVCTWFHTKSYWWFGIVWLFYRAFVPLYVNLLGLLTWWLLWLFQTGFPLTSKWPFLHPHRMSKNESLEVSYVQNSRFWCWYISSFWTVTKTLIALLQEANISSGGLCWSSVMQISTCHFLCCFVDLIIEFSDLDLVCQVDYVMKV